MKKLLFYVMSVITIAAFSNCKECQTPQASNSTATPKPNSSLDTPTVVEPRHVPNQLVINFENETDVDAFLNDPKNKDLKLKLVGSCPCSKKLIVVEAPPDVVLNPDGEVRETAGGHGGSDTGVSWNYEFELPEITKNERLVIDSFLPIKRPKATVIASIIDSGVDFDSPFLAPNLFNNPAGSTYCGKSNHDGKHGLNMIYAIDPAASSGSPEPKDQLGHGTFINGIIATKAHIQNDPRSEFGLYNSGHNLGIAIKQLNVSFTPKASLSGNLFHALCGIHYSLSKKAKVINASWGVTTFNKKTKQMMVFKSTLSELSKNGNDVLLVVSSGNDGINFDMDSKNRLTWPAAFSIPQAIPVTNAAGVTQINKLDFSNNIITVGAWNVGQAQVPTFSNRGKEIVNIYAPGQDVLSLRLNHEPNYGLGHGTSFAAPFVTRTAAILRGLHSSWKAKKIKMYILETAFPYVPTGNPLGYQIRLLRSPN